MTRHGGPEELRPENRFQRTSTLVERVSATDVVGSGNKIDRQGRQLLVISCVVCHSVRQRSSGTPHGKKTSVSVLSYCLKNFYDMLFDIDQ